MSRHIAARRRIQQSISKLRTGPQRRYPAALRSTIADYGRERIKAGVTLTRVSSELGVSHATLVRILDEATPMRRVRVAKMDTVPPPPNAVVRGPAGLVIEGLDVQGVAALVRALS